MPHLPKIYEKGMLMSMTMQPNNTQTPEGWYPEPGTGRQRWWDGENWGPYAPPAAPQAPTQEPLLMRYAGRTANRMPVSHNRAQTGHSLSKWLFLSVLIIGIPGLIYYTISPNHYWHI